jgi:fructose-specific phosphotransferase system IIA component
MHISNYIDHHLIMLDLPAASKSEAFARIVDRLVDQKLADDREELLADVNKREEQGCTAIGRGMAIPHARSKTLKRIVVAMARIRGGIDFGAEDGEQVRLVFLLATPCDKAGEYLKVLARLCKLLKVNGLQKELLKAVTTAEILDLLETAENKLS